MEKSRYEEEVREARAGMKKEWRGRRRKIERVREVTEEICEKNKHGKEDC